MSKKETCKMHSVVTWSDMINLINHLKSKKHVFSFIHIALLGLQKCVLQCKIALSETRRIVAAWSRVFYCHPF